MKMGLDIGYSGVKAVYGDTANNWDQLVMPVGVAPFGDLGQFGGGPGGVRVSVGGESMRAGVEPYLIPGGGRILDADYTKSTQYKALFLAALKQSGADEVECLATGLPVELYQNKAVRNELIEQLRGQHNLDGANVVNVETVQVFPQPAGTYIAHVAGMPGGSDAVSEQAVLVVDPGFYSVDSVVIKHGVPYPSAVSTSTQAMSRVLEVADEAITADYSRATATSGKFRGDLERALRRGDENIQIGSKHVPIGDYVKDAARHVAGRASPHILSSLRDVDFRLDTVVFGGGGARLFASEVMESFPDQEAVVVDNAPLANALGFYYLVS